MFVGYVIASFIAGVAVGRYIGKRAMRELHALDVSNNKKRKNIFKLQYTYRGEKYSQLIRIRRGPKRALIKTIVDETGEDVSSKLREYTGYDDSFGHMFCTPDDFGYRTLIFTMHDKKTDTSSTIQFGPHDMINIH
jgi:hypothetical protein